MLQKNSPNLVIYNPKGLLLTLVKCSMFGLFTAEFVREEHIEAAKLKISEVTFTSAFLTVFRKQY